MKEIAMLSLKDKLNKLSANEMILDVREPDEYREAHIKGSTNIPVGEVAQHAEKLKKYEAIYIHCRSGKRSQMAFFELEKQGLKNLVCIRDGGMLDWVNAGFPIERG